MRIRSRSLELCVCLLLMLSIRGAAQDSANPWSATSAEFVKRIITKAGNPSSVFLSITNRSKLSAPQFALAKKAIEQQMRASSVRLSRQEAAQAEVRVTISEKATSLLWLAEIKQGPAEQFVLLPVNKPNWASSTSEPTVSIRKRVMYSSEVPILDFLLSDAHSLTLLTADALVQLSNDGGAWQVRSQQPIAHEQPWPRDLRGRLFLINGNLEAFLPGVHCISSPAWQCSASDDPWPIGGGSKAFFSASRNFYTGVLANGTELAPFYSAAIAGQQWLFTGVDSALRAAGPDRPQAFPGFGSEIAVVNSACGTHVLVTSPEDWTAKDMVQVVQVANGDAVAASAPLELPGAVIAMSPPPDGNSANAVVRDQVSGRYEATAFTISCQ